MSRVVLVVVGLLVVAATTVWGASKEPSVVTGRVVVYWGATPLPQVAAAMFTRCAEKGHPDAGPFTIGPGLVHDGALIVVGRSPTLVLACHERGSTTTSSGVPADPQAPSAHSFASYGMASAPDGTRTLAYGPTAPEVAAVNVLGPAGQVQRAQVGAGTFLVPISWGPVSEAGMPTFQALDAKGTVLYEGP